MGDYDIIIYGKTISNECYTDFMPDMLTMPIGTFVLYGANMEKKNRVLLVGNGVAMNMGVAKQWTEIIEECAKGNVSIPDKSELQKLPFNMQIVAATNDNVDKSMVDLCRKLKDIALDEEQKAFGKKILDLPFDRIITTNYTFELERSVSDNKTFRCRYPRNIKHKDSDMTLFGYILVKVGESEKQIWHIHGHACAPNSVIMGHYYYGKLLSKIQQYIPNMLKGVRQSAFYKKTFEIRSWVDSFMTDDVYIVGFGMDLCEADIWWLVCCKKRHFPTSRIFFYVPQWDLLKDNPKRILMETYGIVIREIACRKGDFTEFYEKIIKEFSELL